ncbi:MAG: membrane protein insertion efficiency factor YidD [Candidatus Levybacteria bacterium]|nr:membrane protein insertion efficiency factor YidD [Candidatus Levybacteria bacterium]
MKLILFFIDIYQKILSIVLKNFLGVRSFCRYSPSCSEYSKQAIKKYGILRGGKMSLLRLSKCQPFAKTIYGKCI